MSTKKDKSIKNLNEEKINTDKVQGGKVDMGTRPDTSGDHFVDEDGPRLPNSGGAKPRPDNTREGSIF